MVLFIRQDIELFKKIQNKINVFIEKFFFHKIVMIDLIFLKKLKFLIKLIENFKILFFQIFNKLFDSKYYFKNKEGIYLEIFKYTFSDINYKNKNHQNLLFAFKKKFKQIINLNLLLNELLLILKNFRVKNFN